MIKSHFPALYANRHIHHWNKWTRWFHHLHLYFSRPLLIGSLRMEGNTSFSLFLFFWTKVNNCYHYWSSSEDRPGSSRAAAVTTCMDLYGWMALNMPELACEDRQASRNAGLDDLIGSGYRPAIRNFARIYQTDLFYTLRTWKWHHQGCPFRYLYECWISEQFALAASVFLSSFCSIVKLLLFWACVVNWIWVILTENQPIFG